MEESSSGPIGKRRWAAIGPASKSAVVLWMVTPVSRSPAMIARSTGAAPRQRGRREGWTFSQSRSAMRMASASLPDRAEDGLGAELGERRAPLLRCRPVDGQDTVEMVDLVLDH